MRNLCDIKKIAIIGFYEDLHLREYVLYKVVFGSGKHIYLLFDRFDKLVCNYVNFDSMISWLKRRYFKSLPWSLDIG